MMSEILMEYVVIFVTASNETEAEKIGQALLNQKLIACCNIVSPIQSIFHWKGDICNENEVLLILKSIAKNFNTIVAEVQKVHSYEVPEIIALPIIHGSKDYLKWLSDETTR